MIELTAKIAKLKVQIAAAQKAYKKESSALAEFRTMSDEKYKTLAADIKELAQMVKYLQAAITVLQGAQQSRADNTAAGYQGDSLLELARSDELLAAIGAAVHRLPV